MAENTKTSRLLKLCNDLPDCCQAFLLETGTEMAVTTRTAYANELIWFFDYLISYNPEFCELEKKNIDIPDIKKISSQDVSRYLTIYKDQGLKERTIARKRAALSSFFSYLTNNRKIEFNPVVASTKVKVHSSDEVVHLNLNEQVDFLDAINNGYGLDHNKLKYHDKYRSRDLALVTLLLDTGIRVSELNGLDIGDVDLINCSAIITRKGGNLQTIYFSFEARDLLKEYLDDRKLKYPDLCEADPLFATLKGERLAVRSIEQLIKKYSVASIPGKGSKMTPHRMRASYAMSFYHETKDILALQREMGHKSLAATNIYAKADDDTMRMNKDILQNARKDLSDQINLSDNDETGPS